MGLSDRWVLWMDGLISRLLRHGLDTFVVMRRLEIRVTKREGNVGILVFAQICFDEAFANVFGATISLLFVPGMDPRLGAGGGGRGRVCLWTERYTLLQITMTIYDERILGNSIFSIVNIGAVSNDILDEKVSS